MLQRITLVLLVVLLGVVAWLSFQSVASQRAAQREIEALHAEISHLMLVVQRDPSALQMGTGVNRSFVSPTFSLPDAGREITLGGEITFLGMHGRGLVTGRGPVVAEEATSAETWLERFRKDASSASHTDEVARLLREQCSENRALELLPSIWSKLDVDQRFVLLDVLVNGRGERLARNVVHLGATDADPRVAKRAFELLRELTFLRFDANKPAEYLAWYAANKDLGLSEIAEKSVPALVKELLSFGSWNETCALYSPLTLHMNLPGAYGYPEYLREAGALQLIQLWARDPDPKARVAAVQWLDAVKVDEVTARMIVMPMLADMGPRDPALLPAVCQALVSLECTWAWEPLLDVLGSTMRSKHPTREQLEPIATALGHMESARVVPTILAWITLAKDPIATEILSRTALEPLTGVDFDAAHDATWWLNWWSINRAEYPNVADTETGLPRIVYW